MNSEALDKRIKKAIYGRPQSVLAVFPAGFSSAALAEIENILASSWFPQKDTPQITSLKNAIRIDQIHMFSAVELLMRAQCLSDIRLIIAEGKASGRVAFEKKCKSIPWEYYLKSSMSLILQVTSIASHAFHETGLKEILADCLSPFIDKIVKGDDLSATTRIDAELNNDYLTMSISLAGQWLYKREYRGTLSQSAPLREDIAASCINNAMKFATNIHNDYVPDMLFVPFAGTGTFIFEYMMKNHQIAPILFGRDYALQLMPLFRSEHFQYMIKKSLEKILDDTLLYCEGMDISESAITACTQNIAIFSTALLKHGVEASVFFESVEIHQDDFFTTESAAIHKAKNIFLPINPPYGIRLAKNADHQALYNNIAKRVGSMLQMQQVQHIFGFILCPTSESWSAFSRALPGAVFETYHMTQGGIDIRVCQFYLKKS